MRACPALAVLVLSTLIAAAPTSAATEGSPITTQVTVGNGVLRMNYKEFTDNIASVPPWIPSVLDSENGRLPALNVTASATARWLYADVQLTLAHGDTTYNGYLLPAFTPYVGTTTNTIASLYGRVGYPFRPARGLMLVPVLEAGEYFWRRDLGFTEDYSHLLIGLGGKLLWTPYRRIAVDAGLTYGTTLFANMSADGDDFELDNEPYLAGTLAIDFELAPHWALRLSGEYRKWQYGQSPVVNGYLEPRSETVLVTKWLSVVYRFKR